MKITKNIARLAVTAGLTAALSFGGVMAPVTMVFAEDTAATTNGSVTIANVEGNHTEFDGYQIFKADVATVEGKTVVSNITWANGSVKAAVEGVIKNEEPTYKGKTAQDAADWITSKVTGTNDAYCVGPDNIAYKIAAAVDDLTDKKKTSAGVASGLEHGYWLFVTNADTIDDGEAGTSPIFTVVGSAPVEITEKTGIPTVEKKILDDNKVKDNITAVPARDWSDVADSQIGQEINYKLTGTIADNYATYDSYAYKFTDVLSDGLDYVGNSVEVYAFDGTNYEKIDAGKYDVKWANKTLTVEFKVDEGKNKNGLKDVVGVNAQTQIVVFYRAKLNANAVIAGVNGGLGGNPNTVTLTYSNNPMSGGTGTSAPDTVKDYTYGLKINKVDLGTEKALEGAKFTIAAGDTTNGDENSANVKYVNSDGTLSDSKVELSMDPDGVITLTGLDAGVYTVTETSAPDGYTKVEPFTFEIEPTMNAIDPNAGLTALSGTLDSKNQSDKVIAGLTDGNAGDNRLTAQTDSEKVTDGYFNITVGDTKQIKLPLTGLNGVTFTWIAGGTVLCIGVAHLIRSRKRDDGSEE